MKKNFFVRRIFIRLILFLAVLQITGILFSQERVMHFQHLDVANGLSQNTIHGITQDKYGFIWFGTWAGLCKYDGYKFTIYRSDPDNVNSINNNRIHNIYKDLDTNIWVTSFDSLYYCRYNYETDDFTRVLRKEVPVWLRDSLNRRLVTSRWRVRRKNTLWEVNQDNNFLYQTNLTTGKKIAYVSDYYNRWAINDNYVTDLFIDKDEVFWVGTYSGGINKSSINVSPFKYYFHSPENKNSLINNNIRGIAEDKTGNIWIGTRSEGLSVYNPVSKIFTRFRNEVDNPYSLRGNQVRNIFCDKYNQVWIGTKEGLNRYRSDNNTFVHYDSTGPKRKISHNWVYAFTEDSKGDLWIGTWNGIAKYDRQKDEFYAYDPKLTVYPYIRGIIEDKKSGNLWVATEGGGFSKITRSSSSGFVERLKAKHYVNIPDNPNSLINDRIYSILQDKLGYIWLGTGGGLCRFNPQNEHFDRFSIKEGLPDEMIVGLLCDNNGDIWISHKKGISRINNQTLEIQNFFLEDGLQGNEFNEDAYCKTKSGELFFGGLNGLNSFFPDSFKQNKYPPDIVFTELYLFNKPVKVNQVINSRVVLKKVINLTEELKIRAGDKSFAIEFAALHFLNPPGNLYKYMLEGFDSDWILTDANKRIATYSNLKPDKYVFKVLASNSDGVWAPQPKTIKIIVLSPWWGTWWFRISMALLILSIVYSAYKLRVTIYREKEKKLSVQVDERTSELKVINDILLDRQRVIQEQSQRLKETNQQLSVLNTTKDRFFSIIAHDLRNPFHTVLGFSELLLASFDKLPREKVQKYMQLIHSSALAGNNLLENLLHWSRSQTGRISYEPIVLDLDNVLNDTLLFLQVSLQRKSIVIQKEIEPGTFVFADLNMLLTVFRNLLSNAIKFSYENGIITISARQIEKGLEISVADNGVGVSDENKHKLFGINTNYSTLGTKQEVGTGLGLIICKEFIERQGGTIWVESEPGKGSIFKFTLPQS